MSGPPLLPMNLVKRTLVGVSWSGLGQLSSQLIRLSAIALLAGILAPEDFGLLGLGMIVVNILAVVGGLGLGAVLVQRKNIDAAYIGTAFWLNMVFSLSVTAMIVLLSPWLASLLNEPRAAEVILVLSAVFPIQAMAMVPRAMLVRELRFKQIAASELVGELLFGVVGLGMALSGFGAWSLIVATLSRFLGFWLVLAVAYPWRPRWRFDRAAFRDMVGFSSSVMGGGLLSQLVANLDYVIVGRFLGATSLGYYTLAFQLAVLPAKRLIAVINRVVFSTFSHLQDELDGLRQFFLKVLEIVLLVVIPFALLLIGLGPLVVSTFYSDQWLPVIEPIQILAMAGLFSSVSVVYTVYYALGKPNYRILLAAVQLVLFLAFVAVFGLTRGIEGVAWSLALAMMLSSLVGVGVVVYLIQLPLISLLGALGRPLVVSATAAWPTVVMQSQLADWSGTVLIPCLLGCFIGVYSLVSLFIYRQEITSVRRLLLHRQKT